MRRVMEVEKFTMRPPSFIRRAASRNACHVASALRATRWIARQIPPRLMVKRKPCLRMAVASACGKPRDLFINTPRVTASGPTCTAAAPKASEVCSGCRPCTRLAHCAHRQIGMWNRRTHVRRTTSSWYCDSTRSTVSGPPQSGHCAPGKSAPSCREHRSQTWEVSSAAGALTALPSA